MIIGTVAICKFPLADLMVENLSKHCDLIVLRFDTINGSEDILAKCKAAAQCEVVSFNSSIVWNRWNWRQEMADFASKYKPDFVLCPDEDEMFADNFELDLNNFKESDKNMMMFDYQMATDDNRSVPKYPGARHMKAYRWRPGISFRPYRGYAMANFKESYHQGFMAQERINHYCFFTPEMQATKVLHK